MTEVFITNIRKQTQAEMLISQLTHHFPALKVNIDLQETEAPFPCGHSILRVAGQAFESEAIISMVANSGFMCDVLEDKICK